MGGPSTVGVPDELWRLHKAQYGPLNPPPRIARQWRDVRRISRFSRRRPSSGAIVDLLDSTTIGFLRSTADRWAPDPYRKDPKTIDVSSLMGSDRAFTTQVAWWLSRTSLPGGEVPIGLKYSSRHGGEVECYALWIDLDLYGPAVDVASAVAGEYLVGSTAAIDGDDPDLTAAASLLGLAVH